MALEKKREVLKEIDHHVSAILALTRTHTTIYQAWLRSLENERRLEWAQLVKGCGQKGRRRREHVETLISQRHKARQSPATAKSKISAREKREELFVLCTNITVEELINLNHLADLEESTSVFRGIEHLLGHYDFAEAYRRSISRETRRVCERILERFECLVFFLNLVLSGFHSGTGWLHGGQTRLLNTQNPSGDLAKAKRQNERMVERGLSYYCWGIFLGDLRSLTRLRADDDVPESLYGDRHHRPRIPYYANQLFESGLCHNGSHIQPCVDGIVKTWPVIPKTVSLQVIMPLMQGKYWDLLKPEEKTRTQTRIYATEKIPFPSLEINSSKEVSGVTLGQICPQRPAATQTELGETRQPFQSLDGEMSSADFISDEMRSGSDALETGIGYDPVLDLMYGTMFTSFVEPMSYDAVPGPGY